MLSRVVVHPNLLHVISFLIFYSLFFPLVCEGDRSCNQNVLNFLWDIVKKTSNIVDSIWSLGGMHVCMYLNEYL